MIILALSVMNTTYIIAEFSDVINIEMGLIELDSEQEMDGNSSQLYLMVKFSISSFGLSGSTKQSASYFIQRC